MQQNIFIKQSLIFAALCFSLSLNPGCQTKSSNDGAQVADNTNVGDKPKFLLYGGWLRNFDLEDMTDWGDMHHSRGIKLHWIVDGPNLWKESCTDQVIKYRDEFGDEPVLGLEDFPSRNFSPEENKARIDKFMKKFKEVFGNYPAAIAGWYVRSEIMEYCQANYNTKMVIGNLWSQSGVDGFSSSGGWPLPYYPSRNHALTPAQSRKDKVPVVLTDWYTYDYIVNKGHMRYHVFAGKWADSEDRERHVFDLNTEGMTELNDYGFVIHPVEIDWVYEFVPEWTWYDGWKERYGKVLDYVSAKVENDPSYKVVVPSEFSNWFMDKYAENPTYAINQMALDKYTDVRARQIEIDKLSETGETVGQFWYFSPQYRTTFSYKISEDNGDTSFFRLSDLTRYDVSYVEIEQGEDFTYPSDLSWISRKYLGPSYEIANTGVDETVESEDYEVRVGEIRRDGDVVNFEYTVGVGGKKVHSRIKFHPDHFVIHKDGDFEGYRHILDQKNMIPPGGFIYEYDTRAYSAATKGEAFTWFEFTQKHYDYDRQLKRE